MGRGAERKFVQNAIFHGKRHDNKILKVNILLSRNFVVVAQAPKKAQGLVRTTFLTHVEPPLAPSVIGERPLIRPLRPSP